MALHELHQMPEIAKEHHQCCKATILYHRLYEYKGKFYKVTGAGLFKCPIQELWVDTIEYISMDRNELKFSRGVIDFHAKFNPIESLPKDFITWGK